MLRERAYRAARFLWLLTPLNRVVSRGVARLPAGVQARFDRAKRRGRLKAGDQLVPVESLERAYRAALERLGPEGDGDYLEFGVYIGTSMLCMHRASLAVGRSSMRLIGFDSFEGLPTSAERDDDGTWQPGEFRADLDLTRENLTRGGVDWDRTILVPGWYDETLTPALAERLAIRKASVVMIDCDTYLSTVSALAFCAPFIHGEAVLLFDDWHSAGLADRNLGERKAFDEFLQAHPVRVKEVLAPYTSNAHVVLVQRV